MVYWSKSNNEKGLKSRLSRVDVMQNTDKCPMQINADRRYILPRSLLQLLYQHLQRVIKKNVLHMKMLSNGRCEKIDPSYYIE